MNEITFFIRSMRGGGAQRAMVRLATGFADAGDTVEVLTLDLQGDFRLELSPAIKLTRLGPRRLITTVPALAWYLHRQKPTALLVTEPACIIVAIVAKILSRSPTTLLIREGLYPSAAAKMDPHKATRIAYRFAPLLYRFANIIVAIADDMAADLARFAKLDPLRITTIPINPVVTPALQRAAAGKPKHHWFNADQPVVLGVGRLDRQKDFMTLVRAFELVRVTRRCRLVIIGEGPLREELEKASAASEYAGDISLPGFDSQPFPYMANCAVFVLPSIYEGQPNVLIEALACGAPVVATDCPSGPRDVLRAGRYGRLVSVGDVPAMAEAIIATLDTPIDRTLSQARGNEFTLARSAALYRAALTKDGILS